MKRANEHAPIVETAAKYWRETWPYFYFDARLLRGPKCGGHVAVQIRPGAKLP